VAAFFNGVRQEQAQEAEIEKTLPKTIGSLHLEFKRCGRPNCRCNRGVSTALTSTATGARMAAKERHMSP
jgi:hypothetical protein